MKIQFRQTGGYGGLTRGCHLDTSTMSPSEAKALEQTTRKCTSSPGVFQGGADLIRYEFEIQDGPDKRKLVADDMTVTPELQTLIEQVSHHAVALPMK